MDTAEIAFSLLAFIPIIFYVSLIVFGAWFAIRLMVLQN
jgi:hypothetical protein